MDERLKGLIGRPFTNLGRDPRHGLDCWGLVMEVFRRYGIEVPDFDINSFAYMAIDDLVQRETLTPRWEWVDAPTDADVPLVALMRMHPRLVNHAGVYIGHGTIMHTTKGTGVITSRQTALKTRIVGYYKLS
ncbi:MAG: NlpC/P60 family protein [Dehalococcoidales bacterium]|nr:NlpC/P60 family protein [Dehalococcoidales bacterium]